MFAGLRLQVPPAEFETLPTEPLLDSLIKEALSQFKFTGNFFRATIEGGILLAPSEPLELGECYWLVSQIPLRDPILEHLHVEKRRSDRAWFAYRIRLPVLKEGSTDVMGELASYLQRRVIQRSEKVEFVWPTPNRIDPDGVPVFDISVSEILVRSSNGAPQCLLDTAQVVLGEPTPHGFFIFRFDGSAKEALIGTTQGSMRRLRFSSCDLSYPMGVLLQVGEESVQTFDSSASQLIARSLDVQVKVPSHRLWRNLRVNGAALRPLPDGNEYVVGGHLDALNAGSFGEVLKSVEADGAGFDAPWYSSIEVTVSLIVGSLAVNQLRQVRSKEQLIRWAYHHDARALLPKLLSILSTEVIRGVP
ncbi:hypothetical protein ACYX7E_13165 [Luteimonas sp. RIT-PG2_3]